MRTQLKIQQMVWWLIGVLFLVLFFLPAGTAIFELLISFELSSLSVEFLTLLSMSLVSTALHAFLATLLVCLVALPLSLVMLASSRRSVVLRSVEFVALMLFSSPGVAIASAYLATASVLVFLPESGFWAIVICHFLMNVLFLSLAIVSRTQGWLAHEGSRLFEVTRAFSMTGRGQWRWLLFPVALSELRSWAPLLFSWCFFSFAPILMLAGRPSMSSPEVLLFFSLSQGSSGARVLVLMFVYFVVSLLMAKLFSKTIEAHTLEGTERTFLDGVSCSWQPQLGRWRMLFDGVFVLVLGVAFKCFWDWAGHFEWATFYNYVPAMLDSLKLCLLSMLMVSLLFFLVALASPVLRTALFAVSFFGGALLLSFWIKGGFLELPSWLGLGLVAFSVAFSLLGPTARWVQRRVAVVPQEQVELLRSFGLGGVALLRHLYWPALKDVYGRIVSLAALWSLGEVAFSEMFLGNETLAMMARRAASRYQFEGLAWISICMFVLAMGFVVLQRILRRRARGGHVYVAG